MLILGDTERQTDVEARVILLCEHVQLLKLWMQESFLLASRLSWLCVFWFDIDLTRRVIHKQRAKAGCTTHIQLANS